MGKEKSKGIAGEILSFLLYVVVVVGITFLIIHYVGQRTYVSGSSMENTLSDGDNLIVDKITYRFSDPKRYDIIVFPYQYEENTYFIHIDRNFGCCGHSGHFRLFPGPRQESKRPSHRAHRNPG